METRADNPPNGRSAGDGTKKLGKRIEKVGHTAEHVWDRTRDSVSDIRDALDIPGRVERHPYGTVAAAVGIGYVLGGGLFTPLTARIVGLGIRIGVRLALLPMLKDQISELADTVGGDVGMGTSSKRRRGGKAAKTGEGS